MNTDDLQTPVQKGTPTVSLGLYGLAGFVLLAAIFLLLYTLSFRSGADASLGLVRSAFGPIVGQMVDLLISGIQTAGMVFSGLVFIIGVLLFAAGKLNSQSARLSGQVAKLETRLRAVEDRSQPGK